MILCATMLFPKGATIYFQEQQLVNGEQMEEKDILEKLFGSNDLDLQMEINLSFPLL